MATFTINCLGGETSQLQSVQYLTTVVRQRTDGKHASFPGSHPTIHLQMSSNTGDEYFPHLAAIGMTGHRPGRPRSLTLKYAET
ncbi:hypothetical protein BaRGS_00037649 [Batillaria attramentaria]|uniref:Uncharacterized protein n=1 Tax=Batillaria attramentaria TaxID=370345 RepID=A0ABD0J8W6_9CAEN